MLQNILFQFHKGTIRTSDINVNAKQLVRYFNSIKVRLEQADGVVVPGVDPDFNSIKVRLEHRCRNKCTDWQ